MAKAQFVLYTTKAGNINFKLVAPNKETIAVSGGAGYTTLAAVKIGIESIRKNANDPSVQEKVEDQSVKGYEVLPNPKFEIYKDKAGEFRYRLKARNGEILCIAEDGYASKVSVKKSIQSLARWSADAEIVDDRKK